MSWDLISLILLLLLSGFFSSSEIAFVMANKIKIEIRARKNLSAKNALYFLQNPEIFYSTILISNNIVNIAFASLVTVFLVKAFSLGEFAILLLSTALLLVFGELVPKYLARELADTLILIAVLPIRIVTFALYPVVKLISGISSVLTKGNSAAQSEYVNIMEREDIQLLLNESSEAGNVSETETDIINKIIELREQRVYDAMTPRTGIVGVDINSTISEALQILIESGYSKVPVYDENLDNIKGFIFTYDMFKKPESVQSIMREVVFVPETKKSLEMLNEFLEKQISVAIVVDEFGGTAGLITVEDIIEEMLGEIRDEYDVDENVCTKVNDTTFVVSGRVEIDWINEEYGVNIPEGDYATVGGYITSRLGRIPPKGENVTIDHFNIIILRSDKTKVELVKLIIDKEKLEEN